MTTEQEAEFIENAKAYGLSLLDGLAARGTSRAQDVTDLAFAFHHAFTLIMRDTEVTADDRLELVRIVDRVYEAAHTETETLLRKHGRLRQSDG